MTYGTAPAPNKSISSITVAFGLISVPMGVYATVEDTKVVRREFTDDGHPVGRVAIDKETSMIVDYHSIVRKAEASDGTWVELTDEEIKEATGVSSGIAEIVGRVTKQDLDVMLYDAVYQVRPKKDKKTQSHNDASFALLMSALEENECGAAVRVAIRGSIARWGVITSDGYLRLVNSADQVRASMPMPSVADPRQVELAANLLSMVPSLDISTMTDDSSARVFAYVEAKANSEGHPVAPATLEPQPLPVDVFAQLEASIAAVKAQKEVAA